MTPTQQKAKAAAERLMAERGCLVVGFRPSCPWQYKPGDRVMTFANEIIPGKELEITAPAKYGDWETQAKFLGLPIRNKRSDGGNFYFAVLVDAK